MTRFALSPISLALAAVIAAPVLAAEQPQQSGLETISVLGDANAIQKLPGSAHLIDAEQLAEFEFVDINRMVRAVPGLYLLEEDGYGLRPNLGIRGSGSGRSGKLSLMEDGVLIAPAPYADPSAYYFPSAGRLNSIEVLKGPSILKYGPFTVGGAVNMLSTPIGEGESGQVQLEAGQFGENRLHGFYANSNETSGWLVETHQQQADGFREIDRAGSADISKQDYLVKGRLNTDQDATYQQQLEVKLQYSEELSGMSYAGLTDADFNAEPNRRYGFTAKDEMQNRHSGLQLNHSIEFSETFTLHSQAYYNKFKRDWFKVSGAGSLIADANDGDTNAQGILDGTVDHTFNIKHNNRNYDSRGIQVNANWQLQTAGIAHDLTVGLRRHWDEVDRFQPIETYNQIDGELIYATTTLPGSSDNRVEKASANSLYVYDQFSLNQQLSLTAALRYEDIATNQQRYNDPERNESGSYHSNSTQEWLPGLGLVYEITQNWSLLAGVHRGFAPAGAASKDGTGAEISTNYEWGARFNSANLRGELIAFYSDYANTIQNCSVAVPCPNGDEIGSYQLGESEITGLEAMLEHEWVLTNGWAVPLRASYTYTDAEVTKDSDDGGLQARDNFAYLPENVFALTTGLDSGAAWRLSLSAAYQDEMCVNNSCNRGNTSSLEHTEALWVLDAAAHYQLSENLNTYLKIDNLADRQAIINRGPDGARANRPRTAALGVNYSF